jgi:hypothetical protein
MGMALRVQSMRCATEAAIGYAAISTASPVGLVLQNPFGAAAAWRHKPHRYGAGGRSPHHGQNNTARSFHAATPALFESNER